MNEKILIGAGLTLEQAKIYLFLLGNGLSPAKRISTKTNIGRALSYKVIKQLIALGLVEQRDDISKISFFAPTHPQKVKELLRDRKEDIDSVSKSFESLYNHLTSEYNLLVGKPNVQFLDGIEGIMRMYDDILDIGQDLLIISSPIDEGRSEVLPIIRNNIIKQRKNGIKTRAITPIGTQKTFAMSIEESKEHMITSKQVPAEKLKIPAQIIIYGDKVAITNFKESIITVLIESKYIAETFKIMFEYIWNSA
jgi:sugar-specific transcriptional regulator TrmB